MTTLIVTVAVVVLVSATCSLLESVLYAVPRTHVELMAESGTHSGKALRALRKNVDRPITAILSLNTIANTAGAAVAGALAAEALGERWLPLFSGCFTLVILLFAEVIPKTAGVTYSRPLAPFIAVPLEMLVWAFRPLIGMVSLVTRMISSGGQEQSVSEAEIVALARVGSRRGVIDEGQYTVIENILSMQDRRVSEVLTPRTVLFCLPADTTCLDASRDPKLLVHSRIPIYGESPDDIVGIVLRRDVLGAAARDEHDKKLRELGRKAVFIPESSTLGRALQTFLSAKLQMLIVVDEFGGVEGVLTLEDVIEEMLGREIVDESDAIADLREYAVARGREKLHSTRPPTASKPRPRRSTTKPPKGET